MKFGIRMPSLTKRIAARTSWKRYVRHSLGFKAPRGWGWLTNPKKAVYNRVYNRTKVKGCGGLLFGYPPVMRGTLRFQRKGARVEVIGLLDWYVVVFVVVAGLSVIVLRSPVFLLLTVGVIALVYAVQFRRFSQAGRAAAAEW